ncbi:MAG: PAS domain-containing protein [Prevotellaceae bacterium]|jgi:PAS domain S-box-containing protein|nr:PAS domain-containing protein [Prevotellaceae bacterium]
MRKLLVCCLILLFIVPCVHAKKNEDSKDYILLISSSTFREKWTYELFSAIDKKFEKGGITNVYAESLALWHGGEREEMERKISYLRKKYTTPPRAVIFINDMGWYLCRSLFDTVWKGAPVIICHSQPHSSVDIKAYYAGGMNIADSALVSNQQIRNRYNITLIHAPIYLKETIEQMRLLMPDMRHLILLSDNRFSCFLVRNQLEKVCLADFPELSLGFLTYPDTNTDTMLRELSTFGPDTGILYYSWMDITGSGLTEAYFPEEEMQHYIAEAANTPVFTLIDQYVSTAGVFAGGYYISSKEVSDATLAEIGNIIDEGTDYHSTIVTPGTPKTYFNYQTLIEKGIPQENLPRNAVYSNVTISFAQQYTLVIIIAGVAAVLLVILLMRYRMSRQKRTGRQEMVRLLNSILDNLPIAAKVKDVNKNMRYVFWNKEAERIFECPAEQAIGKTDYDVMTADADQIRVEDKILVRTMEPQWGTRHFYNKKGEERFTAQNNNVIQLSDGSKWIVYSAWDITEFKVMERDLKQAKEEAEHAREEAEEANRVKSAFLANMSHEIRTPLNAIVGFSSLLSTEEVSDAERVEYNHIIEQNNALLLQLINDILDLSKMEAGTMEYVYTNADINKMMSEIAQAAILRQDNKEVEIRLIQPLPELVLYTDIRRMTQVINNFMTNAMKFTAKGSITLGYNRPREGFVRFYVEDTGMGIPTEKQKDVFTRFVKLNAFKQGTGLGLAISQQIIKELGGTIGVKSVYGKGSTFWCTLPDKRKE